MVLWGYQAAMKGRDSRRIYLYVPISPAHSINSIHFKCCCNIDSAAWRRVLLTGAACRAETEDSAGSGSVLSLRPVRPTADPRVTSRRASVAFTSVYKETTVRHVWKKFQFFTISFLDVIIAWTAETPAQQNTPAQCWSRRLPVPLRAVPTSTSKSQRFCNYYIVHFCTVFFSAATEGFPDLGSIRCTAS